MDIFSKLGKIYAQLGELAEEAQDDVGNTGAAELLNKAQHAVWLALDALDEQCADMEYNESMDGDFDSAMASAGLGTDEDYGYYGGDEW